jgi:hypothetical protein
VSAHDQQTGSLGIEVDADGVRVLDHLQPGLLELSVYAMDHERFSRWIRIEPGQRLEAGTVELGSPRQISGRVLGRDGKPVKGVEVRVACKRLDDYDPKLALRGLSRTCDAKGEFRFEQLGRGRYLVCAQVKSARHDWRVIDTAASDVTGIELRLGAVQPVTVRCATRSQELFAFIVRDDKGQPIASWRLSASIALPLELPAGRYVLEVWDDHQRRTSARFLVGNEPVEVRYQP